MKLKATNYSAMCSIGPYEPSFRYIAPTEDPTQKENSVKGTLTDECFIKVHK